MSDSASEHSKGTQSEEGADELLEKLLQCDAQLAELLRTASRALLTLAPGDDTPGDTFDTLMHQWFDTLNEIQLTLRQAAHALRQARLPPLMTPASAAARLRGEAGVAGMSHTLTTSSPYSLSTLRLREMAWRHVAQSLRERASIDAPLLAALERGASLAFGT